ncbi:DUF6107 family protein [Mangrovicella endophytica]|uniref:DUF6107 family protein n=1 Tax=Mangrovicella endophytica TaxID=2066697 RepID=UPI000C9E2D1E|nr:DUF6107 family protein [Mangrovicella endophytica]
MTSEPISTAALWAARILGATAGAAISVAYLLPKGRREAAVRFLTGLVTGITFGPPAGLMLASRLQLETTLSSVEVAVMGSAAASLCAWWALGVLSRFAESLFRKADGAPKQDGEA